MRGNRVIPYGNRVIPYLAAVAATGLAALLRWMLDAVLGTSSEYLLYYFSVMFAAIVGGIGPGLLAILLGAVAGTLFFQLAGHVGESTADDALRLFMFLIFGGVTTLLAGRLHSARNQAASRAADLGQLLGRLGGAQDALSESEEKFRSLVENMRTAVGIVQGTRFVYANRYFAEMLGYSVEELLAVEFPQLVHPAYREMMVDRARRRQSGEPTPSNYEFIALTKSGEERWMDFWPARITYRGKPAIIGAGLDITERKRAEEALRQSEEKFRIVAEHTYDWEFWLAPDGRFLYSSPSCVTVTGYDAAAFESDPDLLHRIIHPEDRPLYDEHRGAGAQACGTEEVEFRIIRRDGGVRWIGHTCQAMYDGSGRFLGTRGSNRDITARKLAEEHERKEKTFSESAINSLPGVFYLFQREGSLLRWNRNLEKVTGYSSREISLMGPLDFFNADEKGMVAERINRVFTAGTANVEAHLVRKDGTRVPYYFLGHRMVIDGVPYVVGTGIDITERQRIEAELSAARLAAEQASLAKDNFLAVLSHELRTPLTPVLAAVSLLETETDLSDEVREQMVMVKRNIDLEARLIDDLLDVTRIARGRVQLDRRPVPLCQIIQRAVEVCMPDIEARQLHFGVDLGPTKPYILEADPARLQQVFWNLLKNAIKFTPPDGCIGIRCRRVTGLNQVLAEISDSGIGIEREQLSRIFQPFEQGERSVTRHLGGLGLGLAISKAFVELHGGAISAHSEGRGKGATFRLLLPLAEAQTMTTAEPFAAGEAAARPAPVRRAGRILLVEDHGDTTRVLSMVLTRTGYEVRTATDVTSALATAHEWDFDLLVSDLGLPDRSGLDLIRELRQFRPEVRAIALSGYGTELDKTRSREAGFDEHVVKPVEMRVLREKVASMIAPRP